jgi:hypothetical protein
MGAAVEALPFETPKLFATAVLTGEDFAEGLEKSHCQIRGEDDRRREGSASSGKRVS